MFKIFKKDQKCPICQMTTTKDAIAKYGEKFCSESCVKEYERKNQIAGSDCCSGKGGGGCCH